MDKLDQLIEKIENSTKLKWKNSSFLFTDEVPDSDPCESDRFSVRVLLADGNHFFEISGDTNSTAYTEDEPTVDICVIELSDHAVVSKESEHLRLRGNDVYQKVESMVRRLKQKKDSMKAENNEVIDNLINIL